MTKFILPSKPQEIENINENEMMEIESKIAGGKSLTQSEITLFLDYLTYITRFKLDNDFENATYKNKCNRAQCMIHYYLEDLQVSHFLNRSFKSIVDGVVDHSFLVAIFNVEGEDIPYIIDPTYRQFFESERCANVPLTPGNFIKNEDRERVINFLTKGYMVMNDENTKMYGNSLYFTKASLPEPKIEMSGRIFAKAFLNGNAVISKTKEELESEGLYIKPLLSKDDMNLGSNKIR